MAAVSVGAENMLSCAWNPKESKDESIQNDDREGDHGLVSVTV